MLISLKVIECWIYLCIIIASWPITEFTMWFGVNATCSIARLWLRCIQYIQMLICNCNHHYIYAVNRNDNWANWIHAAEWMHINWTCKIWFCSWFCQFSKWITLPMKLMIEFYFAIKLITTVSPLNHKRFQKCVAHILYYPRWTTIHNDILISN